VLRISSIRDVPTFKNVKAQGLPLHNRESRHKAVRHKAVRHKAVRLNAVGARPQDSTKVQSPSCRLKIVSRCRVEQLHQIAGAKGKERISAIMVSMLLRIIRVPNREQLFVGTVQK